MMLIEHVRSNLSHKPYATLIAFKDENGKVRFGYSKYAKKLEKISFSKKIGVECALENAKKDIILFNDINRGKRNRKNDPAASFLLMPVAVEFWALGFLKRAARYFKQVPSNVVIYCDVKAPDGQNCKQDFYKKITERILSQELA